MNPAEEQARRDYEQSVRRQQEQQERRQAEQAAREMEMRVAQRILEQQRAEEAQLRAQRAQQNHRW